MLGDLLCIQRVGASTVILLDWDTYAITVIHYTGGIHKHKASYINIHSHDICNLTITRCRKFLSSTMTRGQCHICNFHCNKMFRSLMHFSLVISLEFLSHNIHPQTCNSRLQTFYLLHCVLMQDSDWLHSVGFI